VAERPPRVNRTDGLYTTFQSRRENGPPRLGKGGAQGAGPHLRGNHMISSDRARRAISRVAVVGLLLSGAAFVAQSAAVAAVNCDSVFEGQTPADPIVKTADRTQAYAGQTVTFTLTFTATGTPDNVTADCYRVDEGNNAALNALVTNFNDEKTQANSGQDEVQHVTYSIVIPDDASLVGHHIVDRAKATSGSVESRSDLVSVLVVPAPCTENCPSPTPTPTITETPTPTVAATAPTKVKGVTLGQTGTSDAPMLWLGIFLVLGGFGLTGITLRRRWLQR
jgi:hypothetical protein